MFATRPYMAHSMSVTLSYEGSNPSYGCMDKELFKEVENVEKVGEPVAAQ